MGGNQTILPREKGAISSNARLQDAGETLFASVTDARRKLGIDATDAWIWALEAILSGDLEPSFPSRPDQPELPVKLEDQPVLNSGATWRRRLEIDIEFIEGSGLLPLTLKRTYSAVWVIPQAVFVLLKRKQRADRVTTAPVRRRPSDAQVQRWYEHRIKTWPNGKPPPTEAEDLDAVRETLGDVRRIQIRNARKHAPDEWKQRGPRK